MYPTTKFGQYIRDMHKSKDSLIHRCQLGNAKGKTSNSNVGEVLEKFCFKLYVYLVLLPHSDFNTNIFYDSLDSVDEAREDHMRSYPYMLHPFCRFRTFSDTFFSLPYLLLQIYLGTVPAFKPTIGTNLLKNLRITALSGGVFFIFINFFTGYCIRKERKVILNPLEVAVHYFKSYFFVDILVVIASSYEVMNFHWENDYLEVLHLVSFLRVMTVLSLFSKMCLNYTGNKRLVNRLVLVLKIFLSIHISACIFSFVERLGDYENYFKNYESTPQEGFVNYITELTLTISRFYYTAPVPEPHLLISSLVMFAAVFFGTIMFAFTIATILMDASAEVAQETRYNQLASEVQKFARHGHLDQSIRERIVQTYDVIFIGTFLKEQRVKDTIPDNLRRDLNAETLGALLKKSKRLLAFDHYILFRLLDRLKLVVLLPNDHLVTEGQISDSMYFLSAGRLVLYQQEKEIAHLDDGDILAEEILFSEDTFYTETAIAGTSCFLYKLSRQDFVSCIST